MDRTQTKHSTNSNGWRIVRWGGAAALLTVPAIAMWMGAPGVDWTVSDFVVMGLLFALVLSAYEFIAARGRSLAYHAGAGLAVLAIFLLIWMNLAVGIIGSEDNPANGMFAGVISVAVGGMIVAHFHASAMVKAMVATAGAQALVGVIAVVGKLGTDGLAFPRDVIVLTTIFTGIWLTAAALFAQAARRG
jgi:hypothetical protein